ncbi:hypothetical protein BP6252_05892 [Coleophoma cylindrospora]|uniref:Peptidase M20 dimerisation domain-containing protein n=1 Tax=Coleophoma cylindrospora TaxID=1849047 RepID=A0A3D8RUT7_9HELO|nr:hypothetical protein BP6252_05892 [Coleophoma cylindrospora]
MKILQLISFALLANGAVTVSFESQKSLEDDSSLTTSLISLHKSLVEYPSISGSEGVLPFWPYERRKDEIWGRGTVDAKGSVASQIIAVQSLLESSEIGGDVALLFVVGEEKGGEGVREANNIVLSWESVIFGEPTELKLASVHKGGMGFNISAKEKAGHSGYPELRTNANTMLIKALSGLDSIELPWSDRYGNTSLNIGRMEAGVATNVIAEYAYATVLIGIAGGDPQTIQELVEKAIHDVSPDVQLNFTSGRRPVPIDHDIDGFETIVVNYGIDIPSLKGARKRYLYGLGSILVAHSDREHLTVSDLVTAVDGYKVLVTAMLKWNILYIKQDVITYRIPK